VRFNGAPPQFVSIIPRVVPAVGVHANGSFSGLSPSPFDGWNAVYGTHLISDHPLSVQSLAHHVLGLGTHTFPVCSRGGFRVPIFRSGKPCSFMRRYTLLLVREKAKSRFALARIRG
jgi:hypothetical protein